MERSLVRKRYGRRITTIAVVFTLGLLLMGGALVHQAFDLRNTWKQYSELSESRNNALLKLHSSIGYGGFIHNFKNYVLRNDLQRLVSLGDRLDRAYGALDLYASLKISPEERDALSEIRKTLSKYENNIDVVQNLIASGASPKTIDSQVKVNDQSALAAFTVLQAQNYRYGEQFSQQLEDQLWKLINTLFMGLLVMPLVILAAYHYNSLISQMLDLADEKREVRRELADTAAEAAQVKVKHREMEHQAYHCDLTKVANRKAFSEKGKAMLDAADEAGQSVSVLFVDVDDFKNINDELGHDVGDKVLVEVASRLNQAIREGDLVARVGGDEFALIVTSSNSYLSQVRLSERLREVMNQSYEYLHEGLMVSCSVGGAVYPDEGSNLESLIRVADERMYEVKRSGKNGVHMPGDSR